MAHHGVGEGRIARRGEGTVSNDGRAVPYLAGDADRLAAPRVVSRLEAQDRKSSRQIFALAVTASSKRLRSTASADRANARASDASLDPADPMVMAWSLA
jgi:hypothetical protein